MDRQDTPPVDQAPADPTVDDAALASQPIGYWAGRAHGAVTGLLRDAMARVDAAQPEYWVLNVVHGGPNAPTRSDVVSALATVSGDAGEIGRVVDRLVRRGWIAFDGAGLRPTPAGDEARSRIRAVASDVRATVHAGISEDEYAAALRVLRRMIANAEGA